MLVFADFYTQQISCFQEKYKQYFSEDIPFIVIVLPKVTHFYDKIKIRQDKTKNAIIYSFFIQNELLLTVWRIDFGYVFLSVYKEQDFSIYTGISQNMKCAASPFVLTNQVMLGIVKAALRAKPLHSVQPYHICKVSFSTLQMRKLPRSKLQSHLEYNDRRRLSNNLIELLKFTYCDRDACHSYISCQFIFRVIFRFFFSFCWFVCSLAIL